MTYLLDVNVVLALIDPAHSHHQRAHDWFVEVDNRAWATCPIIQNGAIRILSQPTYGNALPSPAVAAEYLASVCNRPGHEFWPDDMSLLTSDVIDRSKVLTPRKVTDTYLLGVAVWRGGKLATIDRRLNPIAVRNGASALELIG